MIYYNINNTKITLISAVKRLKVCLHNMCLLCIFITYIYINTYTYSIYFEIISMYIYINLIDIIYKYFKCINITCY